jgi:glycosyltransferase involved in cell wall biosynthesis
LAAVPLQQHEILQRFRPHIVVTVTKSMNLAASVSLTAYGRGRAAWIAREGNNTGAMLDHESPHPLIRRLQDAAVRGCYQRADAVVAISDGVARGLTGRFRLNPTRVRTIHNAVDVDRIRALATEPLDKAPSEPFVVAAGRLDHQKGFDVLIEAFAAHVAPRGFSLVILGEGVERARLESLARSLGVSARVQLPGFVGNPWAYFARATLFACSSRWEGFGNVIIEALACGAPVVSTDCDFGPREILRHGETGWLVPSGDAEALGQAMAAALTDTARTAKVAACGSRRAEDFSVSAMTTAYETLFRDVLAMRPG